MRKLILILLILPLIALNSCHKAGNTKKAKYVFLFIGDGMGIQQVNAAKVYVDSILQDTNSIVFTSFPVTNFVTTHSATRYITCSAAAGTALSTGNKTTIGTLGLAANQKDTLYSIAKKFQEKGSKVGIVTSVSIDHATPAAFYAHQAERGGYYPISLDLLKSGYDFFASGGFKDPYGKYTGQKVKSIYDLGNEYHVGFTTNPDSIDILKQKYKTVVFSVPNPAPSSTIPFHIDQDGSNYTLADLTSMAIKAVDNPEGFFVMVEGGKVDWACHSNDGATAIKEVISFSDAISQALKFYRLHPDETLIIVTADHETGGMSLGNYQNYYDLHLNYLSKQVISIEQLEILIDQLKTRTPKPSFEQVSEIIRQKTGLGSDELKISVNEISLLKEAYLITFGFKKSIKGVLETEYSDSEEFLAETIIRLINTKAGIGWSSVSHTGSPVPVYAIGQGQCRFQDIKDNTEIPKRIAEIAFSD